MDVTELKHYLHRANIHRTNPSLFKRVSDHARKSDFTAKWSLDQMLSFFTESAIRDSEVHTRPTIDQLVSLFELLDTDKNGYLTSEDMNAFLEHH